MARSEQPGNRIFHARAKSSTNQSDFRRSLSASRHARLVENDTSTPTHKVSEKSCARAVNLWAGTQWRLWPTRPHRSSVVLRSILSIKIWKAMCMRTYISNTPTNHMKSFLILAKICPIIRLICQLYCCPDETPRLFLTSWWDATLILSCCFLWLFRMIPLTLGR